MARSADRVGRRAPGLERRAPAGGRVPSAPLATLRRMLVARLICSGADCEAELEVFVAELAELDRFGCDCGHALVLAAVSEAELLTP